MLLKVKDGYIDQEKYKLWYLESFQKSQTKFYKSKLIVERSKVTPQDFSQSSDRDQILQDAYKPPI